MSLDPPKVLLEQSFLTALVDPAHPRHASCAAVYTALLDDAEHDRVLLMAVADHLRPLLPALPDDPFARAAAVVRRLLHPVGLFAPVHLLHVGHQHRRAARRSSAESSDVALTLVMCDRHRIHQIATVDPTFDRYHLHLVQTDSAGD